LQYLINKTEIDNQLNYYINHSETEKQKKNLEYVKNIFEKLSKQSFYIKASNNILKYKNELKNNVKLKNYFYNKLYSSLELKNLLPSINLKQV
jgi:uncharacterized protein (UPF0335 family)